MRAVEIASVATLEDRVAFCLKPIRMRHKISADDENTRKARPEIWTRDKT